jgi:NTE family protein
MGAVRRIGLVLGAGGLTGTAFHAGVIAGLGDAGWDARSAALLIGTSAGSTSSALLRAGLPPADFVRRMAGETLSAEGGRALGGMRPLAPQVRSRRRQPRPASPALLAAMARRPWRFRPPHLVAGLLPEGTVDMTEGVAGVGALFDAWPQQPTWICAVRLDDGQRVVFGRDASATMAQAVNASCAVPGFYAPALIDGTRHVDGGIWSVHNLDLAAGQGLDLVVVSAPMSTDTWHAMETTQVTRTPIRAQLRREVAAVRRSGPSVLVIEPDVRLRAAMGAKTMDPRRRAPVARAARSLVASIARGGGLEALIGSPSAART